MLALLTSGLHVFPIDAQTSYYSDQAANLHLMVRGERKNKKPPNPTLFQRGGRDSPFCKLTPSGDCGLAISSPPPMHSPVGRFTQGRKLILRGRPWIYDAEASATEQGLFPSGLGATAILGRFMTRMTQPITPGY